VKIKKISKINNIFSFSYFEWDKINPDKGDISNDPTDVFKKNNVLFAENGNGKSNLIKIFKSLNGENVEFTKHWDYPTISQEVKIVIDANSEITFTASKWKNNNLRDKFIIFDKHFINAFVHSTGVDEQDTAQRRQQRGRNIVYLGNFAKYSKEIDRFNGLKDTISKKNQFFIQTEQSKIVGLISGKSIGLEEVTKKKDEIQELNINDLQSKKEHLKKKQEELSKIENALNEKDKIKQLLLLSEIKTIFSIKTEVLEHEKKKEIELKPGMLFSFTLSKGLQKTLRKISHKKDFIKTGISLLTDTDICPFCEQKIKNGDYIHIIMDYQKIFDEAFAEEEENVRKLLLEYKAILENIRDFRAPHQNRTILDQAKPFITIEQELHDLVISEEDILSIKNELNLVLEKERRILDKIEGSGIERIKKIIETTNNLIIEYNDSIKKINEKINQIKKDIHEGKIEIQKKNTEEEISKLNMEIWFIENKEHFDKYFNALVKIESNMKVINSLENIFQKLKNKIIEEFNKFVSDYFDLIKIFVKEISPTMEIFRIEGDSRYDRRSQEPAQCGFCIRYNGEDCTRSLSEGEKQVLSLSFFFAQLRKEGDKQKIIVFDDPITSFDAGKRKSTAEVIQKETTDFEQLFIFTCDPLFREFCLKQIDNRNFYYIFKTQDSSSIHYVPKKRETIYDSFENEFKNIENIKGSNENVVIFGQKLRFCLETKIKEDYFGYSQDNLSNMIEKVTGKGKHKFDKLIDNKDTILQIYKYCNTGGLAHYPKDGSTSWNELKDKIKQYLNLNL
jgi:wobble nucleotide-excising tRNase